MEDFSEEATFEQTAKRCEGVSYADIYWVKVPIRHIKGGIEWTVGYVGSSVQ